MTPEDDLDNVYYELILDAIKIRYGYDFTMYAKSSLRRRIREFMKSREVDEPLDVIRGLVASEEYFIDMLGVLTVSVTEMFRDPDFFCGFREKVVPVLKTYPSIRVWHAGCATGEEVYSLAILLQEENLLERSKIYATDINVSALDYAKQGIYSLDKMQVFAKNYQRAKGSKQFSDYYHAKYNGAVIDANLKKNITFAQHNLVTDGSFSEFNLILCRNVMIYFNQQLQTRVLSLINDSLVHFGVLCVGKKETLSCTVLESKYKSLDSKSKIYQKTGV